MAIELKILNLAFRPLSDEGVEEDADPDLPDDDDDDEKDEDDDDVELSDEEER